MDRKIKDLSEIFGWVLAGIVLAAIIASLSILVGTGINMAAKPSDEVPAHEESFRVEVAEMFIDKGEIICFSLGKKMHFEVHSLVVTKEFPISFVNYATNYDPDKHNKKWCVHDSEKKTLVRVITDSSIGDIKVVKTVDKKSIDMEEYDKFTPAEKVPSGMDVKNPKVYSIKSEADEEKVHLP